MVFCKEGNRAFLQSLKTLVQRDREAGEYIPPNFDSILQSLDEMSAKNDSMFSKTSDVHVSTSYGPGRKEYEVLQAYNSLIEAGGRPVCPLEDTNHVSKDPERYLEILVPWIKGSSLDSDLDWKEIFQQQLLNWQQFRAWQRAHRDVPAHTKQAPVAGHVQRQASSSGGSSSKFEAHVESTRARLTHCGFTKSFCLDNDANRQDDWTTWIEYLSFECYCFDDCSRRLEAEGLGSQRVAMKINYPGGSQVASSTVNRQKSHDDRKSNCFSGENSAVTTMDDSLTSGNTSNGRNKSDGAAGKATKLKDAEHHNLILKWAFLQEPEIAAMCVQQPSVDSVHKKAVLFESDLGRLKRHRDGSLRGATTTLREINGEDISNDVFNGLEPKRCRSSG